MSKINQTNNDDIVILNNEYNNTIDYMKKMIQQMESITPNRETFKTIVNDMNNYFGLLSIYMDGKINHDTNIIFSNARDKDKKANILSICDENICYY